MQSVFFSSITAGMAWKLPVRVPRKESLLTTMPGMPPATELGNIEQSWALGIISHLAVH